MWNYEDRMVEATVNSVVTTFAYRGDGLRNSRTVGMSTTTFTWDINAGLPVVLDDGNQYVYGAGLASTKQGGNWYYYLADGLGSTMTIVDASGDVQNGYTYDVYGERTVTGSLGNEFDFAGQQTDPSTGLQYLRARYYDSGTGTFISREPLALMTDWYAGLFVYSINNPVMTSDPTGLDSPWDKWRNKIHPCNMGPVVERICEGGQAASGVTKLVGEYTLRAILKGLYGLSLSAQAELQRIEFYASLGPKVRQCAADVVCSTVVSAALQLLAVVALVHPVTRGAWGPLQAAQAAWTAYSVEVQRRQDFSGYASPDKCEAGRRC